MRRIFTKIFEGDGEDENDAISEATYYVNDYLRCYCSSCDDVVGYQVEVKENKGMHPYRARIVLSHWK